MPKKSKKASVKRKITARDYQMLKCLWKWKALSTRALAKKFFPKATPFSAYIRLLRLESAGYLEFTQIDDPGFGVWTLSPKGFRVIRPKMVELAKDGFRSENLYHDHLATAFHLGEWLTNQPEGAQTFSEQQLRRISQDLWPSWIPRSDLHRPDGYSLCVIDGKNIVAALETELTLKEKSRYGRTVTFYDGEASIQLVFWLIGSKGMVSSIKRAFEKYDVSDWKKHNFLTLEDFRKKGWMAPIIEGEFRGSLLNDFLRYNTATTALHWRYGCSTLELLDIRKRPINSKPSKAFKNRQIAD